ncbi:MAG: hypothetical protein Q9223_003616 [Gallowayella weberi]
MSNLFKAEHPFSLIGKYFDTIDPVYPIIHRETFQDEYHRFWLLWPDRASADGSLVALIFVMLAMGTQFIDLPSMEEKEETSEFYGWPNVVSLKL